jgi:hypothetical protein
MRNRAQLISRRTRVASVQNLGDMASLFVGTGLEGNVLTIAKDQVTQYLTTRVTEIEAQLTQLGVDLMA